MAIEFLKIPPYQFDHASASPEMINMLLFQTLDPETRAPHSLARSHIIYTSPLLRARGALASSFVIIPELREVLFSLSPSDFDSNISLSTSVRRAFLREICLPSRTDYRKRLVDLVLFLQQRHPEKTITATVLTHTFILTCVREILRDRELFLHHPHLSFSSYDPSKKLFSFLESFIV
jgi:hypothetical protein